MKQNVLFIMIAAVVIVTTVSCSKDDVSSPGITLIALGKENSKKVEAGDELHIDAEITAEGKIKLIRIEIHYEGAGSGWEHNVVYSDYEGLKNTDFHKHLDVPASAQPGDYHFHLIVTDLLGNESKIEDEFEITQP